MSVQAYYNRYWTTAGFNPVRQGPFPELADFLERHARPDDAWLDVGCGDGSTAGVWLQDRGCRYVGADISETAVAAAQALGLNAQVVPEVTELPFLDETFDGVLAVELFEHLFDPAAAAREFHRVLKPGGLLFVSLPNAAYWRRRLELLLLGRFDPVGDDLSIEQPWRDPHIRFFTPKTLGRMLAAAGFAADVHGYAGALLADTPKVGRRLNGRSSPMYRWAERRLPNLLGRRIYAVATKRSASNPAA
jgi:SAM-dependent methyltransferase